MDPVTPKEFSRSVDLLHETAAQRAGLTDFGRGEYRPALQMLLGAFDHEAKFCEAGREVTFNGLVDCLIGRLYSQEGWKRHPEYAGNEIRSPVIIIGLPRSGTTALQRLLANDERFQGLEYWIAKSPLVRPPRHEWPQHPRFRAAVQELNALYAAEPKMKAMHYMQADLVDECRILLMQTFTNTTFSCNAEVPSYSRWLSRADLSPSYRCYVDNIKLIGLNEPQKRWLLKCPTHVFNLDKLLEVFPDARILHTHRDPVKLLPSLCSLVLQGRQYTENPDTRPNEVGLMMEKYFDVALQRAMAVREKHPDQFVDIQHADFRADPLATVRRIYRYLGTDLDERAETRLRGWAEQNPEGKYGRHEYRPEDFGLSGKRIREQFRYYSNHFGVSDEPLS